MKLALALLLVLAQTAHAQLITSLSGGNDLSVGPGTAGFSFTTTASQTIRALGVYDSDLATPGLFNSHQVGLWDATTHGLLASATIPAQGASAIGSFQWVNLSAPLTLPSGHTFVLGASYLDSDFDFARGNISGVGTAPGIALGNALLSTGSDFGFPDLTVSGANLGFIGPNAGFNAVPEPSAWALVTGLGLLAFSAFRRVRSVA